MGRDSLLTAEQREILSHLSIVYLADGAGGTVKTIRVEGVNLQLVNGLGATNGDPGNPLSTTGTVNGLGNLIVGYHEQGPTQALRTGSHNLVTGLGNAYESFGSLVGGQENSNLGPYSACLAGHSNRLTRPWAGTFGGSGCASMGLYAVCVGGTNNDAVGNWASALGGAGCEAQGVNSTVSGGDGNEAVGTLSTVSGGRQRTAAGTYDWAAGALWQDF